MEKKIENYLHLYLGCKVWDDYDSDIKILYSVTCDSVVYLLKKTQHKRTLIEIKPILRPLSDMTEEEVKECKSLVEQYEYVHPQSGLITRWAYRVDYCLKKYFDLFGLIESGLAIDATKQLTK